MAQRFTSGPAAASTTTRKNSIDFGDDEDGGIRGLRTVDETAIGCSDGVADLMLICGSASLTSSGVVMFARHPGVVTQLYGGTGSRHDAATTVCVN